MKATGSLPDRAETEHHKAADEDTADDKEQKKTANPKKKKRNTRPKAVPDVVMLDTVISNSEQGEEEEGSDAEFVALPNSKKVRLASN